MIKKLSIWLLQVAAVSAVVLLAVCPISCKVTDEGLQLLRGDYVPPVLEFYAASSAQSVSLTFSKKVTITGAIVTPVDEQSSGIAASDLSALAPALAAVSGETNGIPVVISYENNGRTARATAQQEFAAGKQYELYGEAQDENGNTLTFCIPFVGFNARVPRMIISGIHPMYASDKFKCEFVELYALTAGNIAGITISSAADGSDKSCMLPAAEVNAGDVVIVHLRTKGDGCVSELGNDLSLSSGWYTSNAARDIWIQNENARLGDKEDVVMIVNSFTDEILDAAMYVSPESDSWSKEAVATAAQEVAHAGFWQNADPSVAASCTYPVNLTAARMLKRSGCKSLLAVAQNGTLEAVIAHHKENWRVEAIKNGAFIPVE